MLSIHKWKVATVNKFNRDRKNFLKNVLLLLQLNRNIDIKMKINGYFCLRQLFT